LINIIMKPIQMISQDLFDKIRSRFDNLEMGDETGAVTIDPQAAMFFDFDFIQEGSNLGRVSISLNDLGSLKVYYSQGITENQDDPAKQLWYSFLKEMRMFAMRRLLRFDTRDIAKTNLDKNDFQHLATAQRPKEEESNTMNESKWNQKSTKKTSRAARGATEVIVRHNKAVDVESVGSRSRENNIKAIFIQNRDGERFKYPFIHPAGAFAMAQHVDHGGAPYDAPGKAIVKMSEQIAQLQEFHRQIKPASMHADAMGISVRAQDRLSELKAQIESLGKRAHYQTWMAEFAENPDADAVMELDAVTMEDYKQKFTQTNFKEELASFFPLIHSIMQETNELDLEEFVSEEPDTVIENNSIAIKTESQQFEEWADSVEQNKLTSDQVDAMKTALSDLETSNQSLDLGPSGQTAWNFFNEFGINDTSLEDKFRDMANIDASTDPLEVFQAWAQQDYPELLVALGMSGTGQPQENPSPSSPADSEQPPEEEMSEDDMTQQVTGMESHDPQEMIKEIAGIVKSFYNRDNPTVGPFRGEEGISLDIGKQISEKYGDDAGELSRQIAEKFMQKLTSEWELRHNITVNGKPAHSVDDGGLARLKELVGNIKAKVENKDVEPNLKSYMMRDPSMEESSPWDSIGKRASAMGGHSPGQLSADQKAVADKLTKQELSINTNGGTNTVPMVRNRDGKLVPDPFAANAAARKAGISENSDDALLRKIRKLTRK
jgi:hypothetical protein